MEATQANTQPPSGPCTPVESMREKMLRLCSRHWIEFLLVFVAVTFTVKRMWFMDDAFIYMRYVDNWVLHGLGLTYNAGEFVEGYTSPLWTLLLSFFRVLGAGYWYLILSIAIASTLLFSFLAIKVNDAFYEGDRVRINFPLAYLCANYGMNKCFSSALESPLVLVCAAGMALYIVRPKSRLALVLTALAPMVRHELILALIPVGFYVWHRDRKFPRLLTLLTASPLVAWLCFRVYYYADFFPNTFHLKDTKSFGRGLAYLSDASSTYLLPFVLFLFAYLMIQTGYKKKLPERLVMLLSAATLAAYVVRVGGDYNHFRLLSTPFILATFACGGILEALLDGHVGRLRTPLAVTLLVGVIGFIGRIDISKENGLFGDVERYWMWEPELKQHKIRLRDRQAQSFGKGPQEKVFVHGSCFLGFRHSNSMMIHRFGLTDPILARLDGVPSEYAGHHWRMLRPATDLKYIYIDHLSPRRVRPFTMGKIRHTGKPGRIRSATEKRLLPGWIRRNVEDLELIERKTYNKHDFLENIKLAFQFPRIEYQAPSDIQSKKTKASKTLGRRHPSDG
jgi:hypothetical protein